MFTSNFTFLEKEYPALFRLGILAEKNIYEDPSTTLTKLRIFSEQITLMLGEFEGFHDFGELTQFERLKGLEHSSVVPREIKDILHNLRKSGNKGSHTGEASGAEALFSKADTIEAACQNLKQQIDSLPQAILAKAFKGELVAQLPSDGDAKDLLKEIAALRASLEKEKKSKKKQKINA